MSRHKQVWVRTRIINECLSKGGYWSKEKLIAEIAKADIDISERSLEYDIALMRNSEQLKYYAPIENNRKKGYYYSDPEYSIDRIPLNSNDIKALTIATTTLAQYKYLPLMQEFTTIIDRVIRVVNRVKQTDHESILDFIHFEKTPVALGLECLDILIDAINNKQTVYLSYQKFTEANPLTKIVHPYFLKEYRNRWYLIALDDQVQKIKTYALDRIKNIENSFNTFQPNLIINKNDFFKNCVGISMVENPTEKVLLEFAPKQAEYIRTQAIHSSQNIQSYEFGQPLIAEYNLVINYELIGIILSYGSDVKVLQPKSLAQKIQDISNRVLEKYANDNFG